MDFLDAVSSLLGKRRAESTGVQQPTNVHLVTMEAIEASSDGTVLVDPGGDVISPDGSQYVEIQTVGSVQEGDEVAVALVGEPGGAMDVMAIGTVGEGDRQDEAIDEAARAAEVAWNWADDAHVAAAQAQEDAEAAALSAASAASSASDAASSASTASASAQQAVSDASTAATAATNAQASAANAESAAQASAGSASAAATSASQAQASAGEARTSAQAAQASAASANAHATAALNSLSTVEDVVDTLTWITEHGTMAKTTDTAVDPSKVYFVRDNDGDYTVGGNRYSIVQEPVASALSSYYELTIDKSVENYIATHLSVTNEGLWLTPTQSGGYRVLVATGGAGKTYPTAGTYIIDGSGVTVAQFTGTGISFADDRTFYIGDESAYIFFDGNGHINIGGSNVTIGGSTTLAELLAKYDATITSDDISVSKTGGTATITVGGDSVTISDGATGAQGPKGDQGETGPQGPAGKGISSITEYYALNNSTSAPSDSSFSTGVKTPTASNRYVWNYELITYTDSSTSKTAKHIAATYGATGSAGKGISSIVDYYAVNNSTTAPADSAFSTTISNPTATNRYLWNYELTTYSDTSTAKTAKRIIGVYGEKGETGETGPQGPAGHSPAITTSKNSDGSVTIYVDGTATSTVDAGEDGQTPTITTTKNSDGSVTIYVNGTASNTVEAGADGTSYYTYVRYSANASGSGMVTTPTSATKYIGVYTGTSSSVPAYTSFKWSKYVGEDGSDADPLTVTSHAVDYQLSTSGTTAPTGTWSTTPLAPTTTQYLWTRTTLKFSDNTESVSYSVGGKAGTDGQNGTNGTDGGRWYAGTKITGTSTTATVFSGSGISAAVVGDMYLNTSTYNTYRCTVAGNASTAKWVYTANIKGQTGAQGPQGETGPQGPQGPQGETGSAGTNGVSITGVEHQYYLSTSSTSQTGGSWTVKPAAYVKGRYYWERWKVSFSSGDPTYTTATLAEEVTSAWAAIEQNDEQIALKANSSDVYTKSGVDGLISTEVTNRNAAITAKANEITSSVSETYATKSSVNGKADASDVTALAGRVSTAESNITQNANNIALKVSESDVTGNYIVGKINLNSTTASIAAQHINLQGAVTISDLSSDAQSATLNSNISVGGRNYAKTRDSIGTTLTNNGVTFTVAGPSTVTVNGTATATAIPSNAWFGGLTLDPGTYSLWLTNTNGGTLYFRLGKGASKTHVWSTSGDYSRETPYVFTVSESDEYWFGPVCSAGTYSNAETRYMLEKGNKATDWTPAPEDQTAYVDDSISSIQVGGRNLLLAEPSSYKQTSYDAYIIPSSTSAAELGAGTTLTIQFWDVELDSNSSGIGGYWGGGSSGKLFLIKPDVNGYCSKTFTIPTGTASHAQGANKWLSLYNIPNEHSGMSLSIGRWKLERGNKATDWSAAPEDVAASAVKRTQRIWYRKSAEGAPSTPGAASSNWVTKADDGDNAWTKMHVAISSSAKYIYTCEQYEMADGIVGYTSVLLDNTITVIDGGNIITGSVTANKLNASDINASKSLTVGAMTDAAASTILNSNVQVGGRNLLVNTGNYNAWDASSTSATVTKAADYIKFTPPASAQWWTIEPHSAYIPIADWDASGTYTVSVDVKFDNLKSAPSYPLASLSAVTNNTTVGYTARVYERNFSIIPTTNDWTHFEYTVSGDYTTWTKRASGTPVYIKVYIWLFLNSSNADAVSFRRLKLERGNTATDWSPAPEDVAKTATSYVTDITGGGIMVHPSSVQNTGVQVTSDVDILRSGTSVANYGSTARIGTLAGKHVTIDSDSVDLMDGNASLATFGANDTHLGLAGAGKVYMADDKFLLSAETTEGTWDSGSTSIPYTEVKSGFSAQNLGTNYHVLSGLESKLTYDDDGAVTSSDTFIEAEVDSNSGTQLGRSYIELWVDPTYNTAVRVSAESVELLGDEVFYTSPYNKLPLQLGKPVVRSASKSMTITNTNTWIDGPSVYLDQGQWLVVGVACFNSGSSSGNRKLRAQLRLDSSVYVEGTEVRVASNEYGRVQATAIMTVNSADGLDATLVLSSSMNFTSATTSYVTAVQLA